MDNNRIHYSYCYTTQQNKKVVNSYVKKCLLDSGSYELYRCTRKAEYYYLLRDKFINNKSLSDAEKNYDFDFIVKQCGKYSWYRGLDICFTDYEIRCCNQIFNNRRARVLRLKKKLKNVIFDYDCLFLTLTFRNKVLDTTNEKTRRVYISRFLRDLHIPFYVANIDYGDLNEREHYHAIVQTPFIDIKSYKYGIIKVERINKSENSLKRIPLYINKLSSHAFKDSTGQCRLIYSKNNKVIKKSIVKLNYDNNSFMFNLKN